MTEKPRRVQVKTSIRHYPNWGVIKPNPCCNVV